MIQKDNIKIELTELGCEDGSWLKLGQDHSQWRSLLLMMLGTSSSVSRPFVGWPFAVHVIFMYSNIVVQTNFTENP